MKAAAANHVKSLLSLPAINHLAEVRTLSASIKEKKEVATEDLIDIFMKIEHENQFNIAIAYLEKAYQLDPTEADYGIVLAAAYFGDNQIEKWQYLYEEISDAFPFEPELWLDWGVALHETGQTEKALNITETALENNPHSIHLLYRLSALCYLSGNQDLSLMVLEKALEFDSEEYHTMFIFAPELKKSVKIMALITKFIQSKTKNE
jgi:tetratricopeptide (TPR) repeat protein